MSYMSRYFPEARALLVLGLPLAFSHVAQVALGATDTLMVGWYGVTELAAITVAGSFFFVFFLATSGFAWAVTPMVAEAREADDHQRIRRVTRMGMWHVTILGTLTLIPFWFSASILEALGQKPDIAAAAQTYLRIAGFGILPALWVMVMKGYLSALEHTAIALWVAAGAIIPNVIINYVLIFGHFGAPELGIRGAAVATLAVQIGSIAAIAWYARRHFPQHDLFARIWRSDWPVFAQVFKLGWPIAITAISEVGLFSAAALLMGAIGKIELAAHGVALQIASLTFVMHLGLSQAATVRAGSAFGRKDLEALRKTAWASFAISLCIAICTIIMFVSVPKTLIGLFLDPAEPQRDAILAVGVLLLGLAALFQLMDGAQVMALGLLRGVQDTQVPMYVAAFSYWGIGLPVAWGLGLWAGWGAAGVWIGLVIGLGIAAVLLTWRLIRNGADRFGAAQTG